MLTILLILFLLPFVIHRVRQGARASTMSPRPESRAHAEAWEQDEPWALDVNYDAYDESEL